MRALTTLTTLVALAGCSGGGGSPRLDAAVDADPAVDAAPDASLPPDGPPPLVSCTGQTEAVVLVTSSPYTGNHVSAAADSPARCDYVPEASPDVELQLDLPDMLTLQVVLTPDFPNVAALDLGRCGGSIGWGGCDTNAPPQISRWYLNNTPGGRYYAVAKVDVTDPGDTFALEVSGVIQPNGRCDLPLATSGALVCAPGTTCNGTACVSASGECGDGVDNDGDGKNGYPADPGCSSITDPTELDDCPAGPGCAACATAADEDGDGKAGYPTDPGCTSPGDLDETDGCPDPFNCPQCANGLDDDLDYDVDLADSACSSAAWDDEYPES